MLARTSRILSLIALLIAVAPASAQLTAYDGFGNGPLSNLGGSQGGTGWTSAWGLGGENVTKVSGAGLTWPGLLTTPGGAVTPAAGGVWPNSIYTRTFAVAPGTSALYVSFLLRDDTGTGIWGGLSFGTYPFKMTVGSPLGDYLYGLQLSEGLGDLSNKPLVKGETTLVVVKISLNAPAAGISYRLYLDPAVGSSEPGFADAMYGVAQVGALPGALSIDNGTGFTTDEIRVGTTWSSVLPEGNPTWTDLGNSKAGSGGRPTLIGTGTLAPGSLNHLDLLAAAPSSQATLVFGLTAIDAAFKGGTLVPEPLVLVLLDTSALGTISLPFVGPTGLPAGTPLFFQYWIHDAGASKGLAASNALEGVTP